METFIFPPAAGPRLVNVTNASVTSTLTMDPALRTSSSSLTQSAPPLFSSNASKVHSHGPGLSKASLGQMNRFYVDCSSAGQENSSHSPSGCCGYGDGSVLSHPLFPR